MYCRQQPSPDWQMFGELQDWAAFVGGVCDSAIASGWLTDQARL